ALNIFKKLHRTCENVFKADIETLQGKFQYLYSWFLSINFILFIYKNICAYVHACGCFYLAAREKINAEFRANRNETDTEKINETNIFTLYIYTLLLFYLTFCIVIEKCRRLRNVNTNSSYSNGTRRCREKCL
ncbi:uncharacterized protein DC041_0004938, partial [Schistosoma bovis]